MRLKTLFVIMALCCALTPLSTHASGGAKGSTGPLRAAYGNAQTTIKGDIARTVVTQVFVNDLPHAVEASYSFPLPADATVTGFSEWRDGRKVTAKTEGKAAAKATYDKAVERGERAAHGETEAGRRFRMTLSGIPAKGSRRIELQYIQTLSALGGERSFVFPAGGDTVSSSVFDVAIHLHADAEIFSVQTPNHPTALVSGKGQSRVARLSRGREGLKNDLVLRWSQDSDDFDLAARAVRPVSDRDGYLEARFAFNADPLDGITEGRDVVIVLDRSLSMAGEPLENAKALARQIIEAVGPKDRLEVITVSTEASPVFGELMPANAVFSDLTIEFVDDIRAGGRSAIGPALKAAGELLAESADGVLVLLSDGQATMSGGDDPFALEVDGALYANTRAVLAHFNYPTRTEALDALFPSASSRFVPNGAAANRAIGEIARLATAPVLEDLSVEILGEGVRMVQGALPSRLPMGESVRLLARFDGKAMVIARGLLHGSPVTLEAEVEFAAGDDDLGLPIEWARSRVRDLQAEYMTLRDEGERAFIETEIRDLGTRYSLATQFTGYVMTDSLAPDHIKPGDPEIRIHAPESAQAVFGILPWGEVIHCSWDDEEGVWFGRFLVPRHTPDGLYKTRIFVQQQSATVYRGALFFRVDSDIPQFELARNDDSKLPVARGEWLSLRAMPIGQDPDFGKGGDRLDPDPVDVRSVEVHVGDTTYVLHRGDGDLWGGKVLIDLPPGRHVLELVATDYARNTVSSTLEIAVE